MKKIKLLLPSLVLILFLSFSFLIKPSVKAAETLTDQQLVDRSLNNINIRTEAIASFPVTYKSGFGATITWESSDNTVIDATKVAETNGWIIVHRDADEEKSATLTVTVTLNEASATKQQEVTVPAGTTITNTYNVTYNFGTLEDVTNTNPTTHKAGDYKLLEDASKEGYTFEGWYSDAAYSDEMNCLPVGMYKDVTVYGKFEKIKTSVEVPTVDAIYEFTYDGIEHKVNITADEKIEVTYSDNNTLTNVGQETVTVTFAVKDEYKDDFALAGETSQTTTLKVNKRAITVKADDVTAIYGEDEKELTYKVTEGTIIDTDTLTFTATKAEGVNVNTYDITLVADDAYTNYDITLDKGTYTINKATLTVTPSALTISKGADLPTTVKKTIDGFKYEDTEAILTGTLVYDFTGVNNNASGTYNFTVKGYNDLENYTIVYNQATIVVTDSTVEIIIADEDLTTTYNGKTQTIDKSKLSFKDNGSPVVISNFTMTYTLNGETVENPKNVGTYVVTVNFTDPVHGTGSTTFDYVINKKDVTITLNEQTHTYDGNAFTLAQDAYTINGLVEEDTIEGIVIRFTTDTNAVNANIYPITADFTENANYTVSVVDSNLVIKKATAVITADDITATYDGTIKSVTATLNHEEAELAYTDNSFTNVKYDAENNVTFYEVTITAAETTNYTAAEKTVKVTINPVELTVTIDHQTAVYSGTEPVVDQTKYSVTEGTKVGTDDLGITLAKAEGVNVNTDGYAITGISSNGNYKVEFVNGTYSITKAQLTLAFTNKTIIKGDELPTADALVYTLNGFVNEETNDDLIGFVIENVKYYLNEDEITDSNTTGVYTIKATVLLGECNYEITTVSGTLTIELSDTDKVTADLEQIKEDYKSLITTDTVSSIPDLVFKGANGSTIVWTSTSDLVNIDPETGKVTVTMIDDNPVVIELIVEVMIDNTLAYERFEFSFKYVEKPTTTVLATFDFGTDDSKKTDESKQEGTDTDGSYSETNNGYTLNLTNCSKVFENSYDATGNACIKLGTSKEIGKFTFTVEKDVDYVIIMVAGYKTSNAKIKINGGKETEIKTHSSAGEYTEIRIDTSTTKTITFETVSSGNRCKIDSITYYKGK